MGCVHVGAAVVLLSAPLGAAPGTTDASAIPTSEAGNVVINEVAPSGLFGSTDEYVELRNTTDDLVVLGGWQLMACVSAGSPHLVQIFAFDDVISPGELLWLAHVGHQPSVDSPSPYGRYSIDVPDDGGWLLSNTSSGYTDMVGLSNGLECTEGSAALQCDWPFGEAIMRDEDGSDTDDNAVDFACKPGTSGR